MPPISCSLHEKTTVKEEDGHHSKEEKTIGRNKKDQNACNTKENTGQEWHWEQFLISDFWFLPVQSWKNCRKQTCRLLLRFASLLLIHQCQKHGDSRTQMFLLVYYSCILDEGIIFWVWNRCTHSVWFLFFFCSKAKWFATFYFLCVKGIFLMNFGDAFCGHPENGGWMEWQESVSTTSYPSLILNSSLHLSFVSTFHIWVCFGTLPSFIVLGVPLWFQFSIYTTISYFASKKIYKWIVWEILNSGSCGWNGVQWLCVKNSGSDYIYIYLWEWSSTRETWLLHIIDSRASFSLNMPWLAFSIMVSKKYNWLTVPNFLQKSFPLHGLNLKPFSNITSNHKSYNQAQF